jgi:hypothetical protein
MSNLAMQGPLLSNGSTTNAKSMQPHNLTSTESFVAMQPQGMMHTQSGQLLPPASGAVMGGGNPLWAHRSTPWASRSRRTSH